MGPFARLPMEVFLVKTTSGFEGESDNTAKRLSSPLWGHVTRNLTSFAVVNELR